MWINFIDVTSNFRFESINATLEGGYRFKFLNYDNCQAKYLILSLLGPMLFSIKLHTIRPGCSIVYSEESQVIMSKNQSPR